MNKSPLDISIVVAFHNHAKMTIHCIESIYKYGPNVKEILVISNNSSKEELLLVQNYAKTTKNMKVLVWDNYFNYQKEYNWGVSQTKSKFVLMLNNDMELRPNSKGLIERMYEKASLPDVGIVGCTLLYGDERQIQHAGIYLMPEGLADHMYVRKPYDSAIKYAGSNSYPYDISKDMPMTAVTGAAQLVEKRKFNELNGFDEKFIVCGGDVDLCIRHNKAGYQTWFVGGGYILHKESISRKFDPIPAEDFFNSYHSYIQGYDAKVGDPFLPEITKTMKINGV
jgi:GT2 family glycosyltransferase